MATILYSAIQMTLSIRKPEADALARRLAEIDHASITDAVVIALKEAINARIQKETPLALWPGRKPVSDDAYHDLDHDLTEQA